ncbi:MAG: branched-chain amino acid transaminase [Proteobacteria bacterium]|nr:branched-chain amino acid transaminase [Pseudomonadota bacterium]
MTMKPATYLWHDGRIKPWHEATVHVGAHVLHYGSSVFEGERVYATPDGPRYFRLREHTERLFRSARIHDLSIRHTPDEIDQACADVVLANGLDSAYVRPLVYRAGFTFSLAPDPGVPVEVAIIALPWGNLHGDGVHAGIDVCVSSWHRPAPNTLPSGAKAGGNYLSSQLIAQEAKRGGYAEGIALAPNGLLSEGAGENLFLVQRGRLYTPPVAAGILAGITRDSVLVLAAELGIDVVEGDLPRELLYTAEEVFLTGTAAEITPVRSVDRKPVGKATPGPVTRALQDAFFGLFDGRHADRHGWLTPLHASAALRTELQREVA